MESNAKIVRFRQVAGPTRRAGKFGYRLLSLDVFDTCLIRDFVSQESLWLVLGQRLTMLLPGVASGADFAARRALAENDVRMAAEAEDTCLADIYRRLGQIYGWSDPDQILALHMEEELEAAGLRVNPAVLAFIEQIEGVRLCYLTDTPHRGAFIQGCLDQHGLPPGPVLSSADLGVLKRTGSMFREALTRFGADRTDLLHVGNDYRADGLGSAMAGVAFGPLLNANPNRYERSLDSPDTRSAGLLGPCLAGAGRVRRLSETGHPLGLIPVVTGVAGPVILTATAWSLLAAEADGIERLYFAARDGETLLAAARILQQELGLAAGVECRYLYGSRRAWHLPALSLDSGPRFTSALRTMLDRSGKTTLRELLAQLDLTDDEQEAVCARVIPGFAAEEQLGDGRVEVVKALAGSSYVQAMALARARSACADTVSYLRQEGMFDGVRVGLVDIGWLGHAAASLVAVAGSQGAEVHCYFAGGLCGKGAELAPKGSQAFLVDARGEELAIKPALVHLLETFCAGTEPSTIGFDHRDGGYFPRFDAAGNDPALAWGLTEYQALVRRFVQAAASCVATAAWTITLKELDALRPALLHNLDMLWRHPTYDEARHWGEFPFDGPSGPPVRLGRALSRDEVVTRVLHPISAARRPRVDLPWRRGALVRSFAGGRLGNPISLHDLLSQPDRAALRARAHARLAGQREVRLSELTVNDAGWIVPVPSAPT